VLLTKSFPAPAFARGLESWSWLDFDGKTPVIASLFGDVFLQGQDGGYWVLDTIEGTLVRRWSTRDELQASLDSVEGQDQYLLGGLVHAAQSHGLTLTPTQVYAFEIAPVLGRGFDLGNVIVQDFVVALNIAGRLRAQMRLRPPGDSVTGFTVTD
jgi:hypothetical protein